MPSSGPTAQEVAEDLLRRIRAARFGPGVALESDDEVARRYEVSKDVARRAWQYLARNGHVVRRHGLGTFTSDEPAPLSLEERVAALERRLEAHEARDHPNS